MTEREEVSEQLQQQQGLTQQQLDGIRARAANPGPDYQDAYQELAEQDVPLLLAEVERLQQQVTDLQNNYHFLYEHFKSQGEENQRLEVELAQSQQRYDDFEREVRKGLVG